MMSTALLYYGIALEDARIMARATTTDQAVDAYMILKGTLEAAADAGVLEDILAVEANGEYARYILDSAAHGVAVDRGIIR